jgi:large subunit ribosomal protein L3
MNFLRPGGEKQKVSSKKNIEHPSPCFRRSAGYKQNTMKSIIGKKIGMTSVFDATGKQTAVTIIEAGPCVVTQKKTIETDGYNALQIAFGDKKEKHSNKPEINHFAKAQTSPKKVVKELRDTELTQSVGETITVDIFAEGDKVEVIGTTKGKGFQGVVKRYGFAGVGGQTHGQHNRLRAPGSMGNASFASRVIKGKRLPGRMGTDRVKTTNLKVIKILADKNLILVSGSVPGAKNSTIILQK